MDKNRIYFVKTCQVFSSRLVHVLVYARTGKSFSARCSPTFDQHDYFSLRIEELSEVTAFLKENIQNFPPSSQDLTIDFLMCIDGCYLPMESWRVSVGDGGSPLMRSFDLVDQNGDSVSSFDLDRFSCDVANLLKASMAAARATPMFRYFVKIPESEKHIIFYRVSEGPPEIELGEGQKHCHIGNVCTPLGSISLDVFYRVDFQTCKTSCCSREASERKLSSLHVPPSRRSFEDGVGAYFPFQPAKRLSGTSFGNEISWSESGRKNPNSRSSRKDLLLKRPSFYLEKASSSGDSNASSLIDADPIEEVEGSAETKSCNLDGGSPVPFLALLTASYTENTAIHRNSRLDEEIVCKNLRSKAPGLFSCNCDAKSSSLEDGLSSQNDGAMYESVASTVVFSPSKDPNGQDPKVSNYSFLSSDDESIASQADNASENSFIKVPFALLPTGDPSNVGDFILFLRRCEMQEFAFAFDRMDLLIQQLAQFETRRHSFDQFLADITESIEM